MKLSRNGTNSSTLTLDNGDEVLFSYETPVAAFLRTPRPSGYPNDPHVPAEVNGLLVTVHRYSKTTTNHINRFAAEHGLVHRTEVPAAFFDTLLKK